MSYNILSDRDGKILYINPSSDNFTDGIVFLNDQNNKTSSSKSFHVSNLFRTSFLSNYELYKLIINHFNGIYGQISDNLINIFIVYTSTGNILRSLGADIQ